MYSKYKVEEDKEEEPIKFSTYLKTSITDVKLERKDISNILKTFFTNGAEYDVGTGEMILPNKEKFIGRLIEDKYLGKGKYYWPNGQKYFGSFDEKNDFHSEEDARLIFENGDYYVGLFEHGKMKGEGTYTFSSGKKVSGDFNGNKINGQITIDIPNKSYFFQGNIVNKKKEGPVLIKKKIGGKIYSISGVYKNNKKEGVFEIKEVKPEEEEVGFYLKGPYSEGDRDGFFKIIDPENNAKIESQYFSLRQQKNIKAYNKEYKVKITGNESALLLTGTAYGMKRLKKLFQIQFKDLTELDLSRCQLKSLGFFQEGKINMINLISINLSHNKITSFGILSSVELPNLRRLFLNDNEIQSVACLPDFDFSSLELLDLSCNPISSLAGFDTAEFPKLFELSLYRLTISSIEPLINARFPSLVKLDLHCNRITSHKNITPELFKKCRHLSVLNCSKY